MTDKWNQYKFNQWDQYHSSNFKKQNEAENEEPQYESAFKQEEHPYLAKLAEILQGTPGLETAGNIAGHINRTVEGTGLPSLAKGFLGSGIEMGRGLTNLIPGVNIPKQQMPELNVNPYLGQGAEITGSFGMGGPVYKGYQAVKGGINALPYMKNVPSLIKNILAGSATGAAISPEHRKLGAGLGAATELLPEVASKAKSIYESMSPKAKLRKSYEANIAHEREKDFLADLENAASFQFNNKNPEKLAMSAAEKEKKLNQMERYKQHHIGEEQYLPGHQLPHEFEFSLNSTNDQIRNLLGEGQPNSNLASQEIVNRIEGIPTIEPHPKTGLPREVRKGGIREEIGKKYDELENNLPDLKIPHTPDSKAIDKEMKQLVGSKALTEEQKENFRKILESTHPSANKEINGKAFFRAYRSLRKMEGEQRSKAFGLSPKEHDEWLERANQTKNTYEQMEHIINANFPKDTIKRLHEINHEYANKVAPLHDNPYYQSMLKNGRYKGNLIENISGTTKGNEILRNIIQNDPQLSRQILGDIYASNPEKLMKPNSLITPYVRSNPELSHLMQQQRDLTTGLKQSEKRLDVHKNIAEMPKLQKEFREQNRMADELKTQSQRKDLSRKEQIKAKAEYEEAQRKAQKMWRRLIGLSTAVGLGGYTVNKIRQ